MSLHPGDIYAQALLAHAIAWEQVKHGDAAHRTQAAVKMAEASTALADAHRNLQQWAMAEAAAKVRGRLDA